MLGITHLEGTRETYTDLPGDQDSCLFGLPSPMELTVRWNGRVRSFAVAEFSLDELIVVDFCVSDIDLCAHETSIDYCDHELIDEVSCRVIFRGFVGEGLARLQVITQGYERIAVTRLFTRLRDRVGARRELERAFLDD